MEYEKQFKFWRFTKVIRVVDHLNQNDEGIFITWGCFIFNGQLVLAESALSALFTSCECCCAYSIVCFPCDVLLLIACQLTNCYSNFRSCLMLSQSTPNLLFHRQQHSISQQCIVLKLSNLFSVSDQTSVWLIGLNVEYQSELGY